MRKETWQGFPLLRLARQHCSRDDKHNSRVCFIPRTDTVINVEPDGETDVYDFQMADPGHNFVANGIIVHNCGKSRVAIELAWRAGCELVLVLCPLRVVSVWGDQFERHLPGGYHFLALDQHNKTTTEKTRLAAERIAWASAHRRALVIAINYESARQPDFARFALSRPWPLIIADESHKIKNASGALSRFVGRLGLMATRRLALTGTPMPHSPLDVWAQYRFLDRSIYDETFTAFRLRYAVMGGVYISGAFRQIVDWQNLEDLRRRFFSIAFQVGPEVLDLPGERDQDLYARLTIPGRRVYDDLEQEFVAVLKSGVEITATNKLAQLVRLQQITSGAIKDDVPARRLDSRDGVPTIDDTPARQLNGRDTDDSPNQRPDDRDGYPDGRDHYYTIDTAKAELLEDLLEDFPPAEPIVIFGRFHYDLDVIHHAAAQLGRASGEVSGRRGNDADLKAWQRGGPKDPVILAVQMQSGGVGIDLTRAAYAIYYSTGFSLGDYLQSRARLYRAGQKRPVMFYHLYLRGTIDEYVARAIAARQDLVESVLKELRNARPAA
jgi:SNF2 family DNA or RNA helicase